MKKRNFINEQKNAIAHQTQRFYKELHENASCDIRKCWGINENSFHGSTTRDPTDIANAFSANYKEVLTPKNYEHSDPEISKVHRRSYSTISRIS